MKQIIRSLLPFIIIISIIPAFVFAEEKPEPRLITVTGDAEVRVVPDEVMLTLGVETWNKELNAAKQENDRATLKNHSAT